MGVSKRNLSFTLSSGVGVKSDIFAKDEKEKKKVVLKGSLASVQEARLMTDGS